MHHTSRPQPSVRHNIHQAATTGAVPPTIPLPQMHSSIPHHAQPLVTINGPSHVGPSPPPPPAPTCAQQQHLVTTNLPSTQSLHGVSQQQQITPYIPPHQRDTNRLNQHVQQQFTNSQTQPKINRVHTASYNGGLSTTTASVIPSNTTQQQQHQVLQQNTNILTNSVLHQQQPSQPHQQQHPPSQPPLQSSSLLALSMSQHGSPPSSSHQQATLQQRQQQQQQQHNQSKITILSQNSNVQQKQLANVAVQLQHTNSQQQKPQRNVIILQKNSQNMQQQLNNSSHQNSSQSHQVQQHIVPKSRGVSVGVNNNIPQQQQHQQLQQSFVQSNQASQTTTTNKICAKFENTLSIATQNQQQLTDKTDQSKSDLICDSLQFPISTANEISLSNTKEKTPMCLVNELARYNKIQHQYRLTGEQGPAHSKRFTVTLKLVEEEYTADGPSIKKAQHSAAAEAVLKTKYVHPPVKSSRLKSGRLSGSNSGGTGNITPTVELNALAMKLGKPTVYVFDSPPSLPPPPPPALSATGLSAVAASPNSGQPLPPPLSSSSLPYNHYHHPHSQHHHTSGVDGNVIATINGAINTTPLPISEGITPVNSRTITKSTNQQQNNFSMHISNHTYFQEGHHYQSYSRNNSINVYQPPVARYSNGSSFSSKRSNATRNNGFYKFNPHPRMTNYSNGMQTLISRDMCKITLIVGKQKFIGIGETPQAARHDAATRALEVLKPLASSEETNDVMNTTTNIDDSNSDLKSPISLVHEMALKRNLKVTFEVKLEKGPPHMKTFVTICKVENIVTEGEGNGKKISKKRAAEKMLEELKKLPQVVSPFKIFHNNQSNVMRIKNYRRKPQLLKKKTKNIIKDNSEPENNDDVNPISKLIQIQQALKEREPVYTLVEEKGAPRRHEFIIEVSAGGHVARGTGPNKKIAKKLAAKNLLTLLGYDNTNSSNKENNSKIANGNDIIPTSGGVCGGGGSSSNKSATNKKTDKTATTVTYQQGGSGGCQIVPGLLLLQQQQPQPKICVENNATSKQQKSSTSKGNPNTLDVSRSSEIPLSLSSYELSTATTKVESNSINSGSVISEITTTTTTSTSSLSPPTSSTTINNNNSKSNNNNTNNNNNNTVNCDGVRPKDQLLYLADLLGFQVVFSDYPKGNHGEYLTIVTLSTDPPQICHGAGIDTEASQDKAAMTALQMLSNLGLDNVRPKRSSTTTTATAAAAATSSTLVNNVEKNNSTISGISQE